MLQIPTYFDFESVLFGKNIQIKNQFNSRILVLFTAALITCFEESRSRGRGRRCPIHCIKGCYCATSAALNELASTLEKLLPKSIKLSNEHRKMPEINK